MDATGHMALIGFGEAGRAFADAGGWGPRAHVFDRLTDRPDTASAKRAEYAALGVTGCDSLEAAVGSAGVVISVVTADQALAVGRGCASALSSGALYLDFNSVAPQTKRSAAQAVEGGRGRYVDVAVMSPVEPARLGTPLLVSGPEAASAAEALTDLGFRRVRVVGDAVGRASAIKMIRSILVKGVEAVSAECVMAAEAAGVLDEVIASLDESWPGADWRARSAYNLERMMVHGVRRAAEMREVARTVEGLGLDASLSQATADRQAAIGALGLKTPPEGLEARITAVVTARKVAA